MPLCGLKKLFPWRVHPSIFRDQQGLRQSRDSARMKYLFMKEGWTAEKFLDEVNERLGYKLAPGVPEEVPTDILRDHAGIHPQKPAGNSYVGASVLRGRLSGEQLEAAADLAERSVAADCGPRRRKISSLLTFP